MPAWTLSPASPRDATSVRRQVTAVGGIIILMVLCASYTLGYQSSIGHTHDLPSVPPVGFLALQLFFASTGWRLSDDLQTERGWQFLRGRLLRFGALVAPAVMLAFLLARFAKVPGLQADAAALPANLMMVADLVGVPRIDEAHWRLKIEMMLSFELGLVWFGLGRQHLRAILATGLIASGCLLCGEPVRHNTLTLAGLVTLDGYLPVFAFGVALLHLQKNRTDRAWLIVCAAAAVLGYLSNTPAHGAALLAGFAMFALAAEGRIRLLARMAWLVRMGELAFPIYVVHRVSGFVVIYHLEQQGVTPMLAIAVAGVVAILLGWGAHHMLERPAMALMARAEQAAKFAWARTMLARPGLGHAALALLPNETRGRHLQDMRPALSLRPLSLEPL